MPNARYLAAAFFATFATVIFPRLAHADDKSPTRTITVSGIGEVRVEPDEVILCFGIQNNDKDLKIAKKNTDQTLQRVLKFLGDSGIKPDDIQTDEFDVDPIYPNGPWPRGPIISYWVNRGITVHLRDVSKFENLVQGLFESGVNQFDSLEFRTSELKKHREKARELALSAASEKGVKMSAVLDQKIGRPITISEQAEGWWGSRYYRNIANSQMNQVSVTTDGGESSGETFARGRIMIKATVTVAFELQ